MRRMREALLLICVALAVSVASAGDYLWTELIAFDNTKQDYGVGEFLSRRTELPEGVSFLLVEPEIVNAYRGLEKDYPLSPMNASYCARPYNEERRRQDWTAWQLRGLVAALKRKGVESYASFFEDTYARTSGYYVRHGAKPPETLWFDSHAEIGSVLNDGTPTRSISPIKRFADGTPYEDYFTAQLVRFLKDFGFAGFHASDGWGHPRFPLVQGDFSDDVISQFAAEHPNLDIPGGKTAKRSEWILANARAEWSRFHARRYARFLGKVTAALHANGLTIRPNTTWTYDPFEALYRYGEDYRLIAAAGVDGFVNEASATVLTIEGWNYTEASKLDKCRAALLRTCAAVKTPLTRLACIKDGMEQYSSLRHAPALMEAELISLALTLRGDKPAAERPFWCLADGITADEWKRLADITRKVPEIARADGVRVVWNDEAHDRELDAYVKDRLPSSCMLLADLIHGGAVVSSAVRTEEALADGSLPLLVLNPGHFPPKTLVELRKRSATVVEYGYGADGCEFGPKPADPEPMAWTRPLTAREIAADRTAEAVRAVNAVSMARPDSGMGKLRVMTAHARDGGLIIAAINEGDVYLNSKIIVRAAGGEANALTEYPSLPVRIVPLGNGECRLLAKIPPRGIALLAFNGKEMQ